MKAVNPDDVLRKSDVAELLKVDEATISEWLSKRGRSRKWNGKPFFELAHKLFDEGRGPVFFLRPEVMQWLAQKSAGISHTGGAAA